MPAPTGSSPVQRTDRLPEHEDLRAGLISYFRELGRHINSETRDDAILLQLAQLTICKEHQGKALGEVDLFDSTDTSPNEQYRLFRAGMNAILCAVILEKSAEDRPKIALVPVSELSNSALLAAFRISATYSSDPAQHRLPENFQFI